MLETRLCRCKTRSREDCHEWLGYLCELVSQQRKVCIPVRLLQSLSVTVKGFSFQDLLSQAFGGRRNTFLQTLCYTTTVNKNGIGCSPDYFPPHLGSWATMMFSCDKVHQAFPIALQWEHGSKAVQLPQTAHCWIELNKTYTLHAYSILPPTHFINH